MVPLFRTNEIVGLILGVPLFFGSMIISAFLSSTRKNVAVENGTLTVGKSHPIQIDQIEWYYEGKNFLLDGIRIKTKQKKNYYYSTINLFHKNSNFKIFKEILFTKSLDHRIPKKTTRNLYIESKYLRIASTIGLILFIAAVILSFVTDFRIDPIKLFYEGTIIIGAFISTRK
jgi:hypothetical protein